jgi:hypothetical protein
MFEGHNDGCQLCSIDRVYFKLWFDVYVCGGVCLQVYQPASQRDIALDLRSVCLYEAFGVPFYVMGFGA